MDLNSMSTEAQLLLSALAGDAPTSSSQSGDHSIYVRLVRLLAALSILSSPMKQHPVPSVVLSDKTPETSETRSDIHPAFVAFLNQTKKKAQTQLWYNETADLAFLYAKACVVAGGLDSKDRLQSIMDNLPAATLYGALCEQILSFPGNQEIKAMTSRPSDVNKEN